ncbi:MAG: hypothetical protein WCX12_03820 [Candidatus Paceibacterota bacterium]|jgi:hypothetical protein
MARLGAPIIFDSDKFTVIREQRASRSLGTKFIEERVVISLPNGKSVNLPAAAVGFDRPGEGKPPTAVRIRCRKLRDRLRRAGYRPTTASSVAA